MRAEANGSRELGMPDECWTLCESECRELADRLDDLNDALRLLRVWLGLEPWKQPLTAAVNLLAKYEAKED